MFGWNYKGLPYILAAHNWDFDGAFLHPNHELISRAVCTKRLAQHLWPELTSHRNQSLRYSRNLNVDTFGIGAHRALGDALVTAALLRNELQSAEFLALGIKDVDALIDYAESPIILSTFPFGKHKGKLISEVPDDYIAWCLRDMKDLSRDMRATLEQRLGARA
jgi:exodeoxyribonuclease X